jgi:hypothetical protein
VIEIYAPVGETEDNAYAVAYDGGEGGIFVYTDQNMDGEDVACIPDGWVELVPKSD